LLELVVQLSQFQLARISHRVVAQGVEVLYLATEACLDTHEFEA
jgi:hypothetical protein